LSVAQPENWTPTYASFATDRYRLPLGVQVTVISSADAYLLILRDRMRMEPRLLREYNKIKRHAAAGGPSPYWQAKSNDLKLG
jgi:GrpB-like predicted nucleotidyltransferase (UPF0157 family)